MDFKTDCEIYIKNPEKETLCEAAEKLLGEMTLNEKIRLMKGSQWVSQLKMYSPKDGIITVKLTLQEAVKDWESLPCFLLTVPEA